MLKGANEEDPCFLVSTSFEKEELDDVVRMIKEEDEEEWNLNNPQDDAVTYPDVKFYEELKVEQVIKLLEEKGYIQVISMGPEIIEIW